ncbi:MAG: hypothetical protein ACM3Q2_13030 [Syntrophothermus sp.]
MADKNKRMTCGSEIVRRPIPEIITRRITQIPKIQLFIAGFITDEEYPIYQTEVNSLKNNQ